MANTTNEDDIILIDNIRRNRVLYDNTHDRHKDNTFKDSIWYDISVKTGKSVYQCKRRWKNIKMAYIKSKKKSETGVPVKSNNNWSLSAYVSFLDTVQFVQNTITYEQSDEIKHDLGEHNTVFKPVRGDEPTLSSAEIPTFSSNEKSYESQEDKIAIILAEGLKERNEMLYNCLQKQIEILDNTSFTVTIQNDKNTTPNVQNSEIKDELARELHVNDECDRNVCDDELTSTQLSLDNKSCYLAEKLAHSKERNTILYNLLKQIEILNCKSETTKSLDLFFKSVSIDIQDFCPRAIDEVKPKILKCVSEVREIYSNLDTSSDTIPSNSAEKCTRLDEENTILCKLQKRIEIIHNKLETTRSMDLFFKSVSADMDDFCIRAVDEVKLKILKCVSEVKGIYSNLNINCSPTHSDSNSIPNCLSSHTPPVAEVINTALAPDPVGQYITYYNVPLYCNEQSNFTQTYF